MKVFVVLERGEELPDAVFLNESSAKEYARERGSEEDFLVHEMEVNE